MVLRLCRECLWPSVPSRDAMRLELLVPAAEKLLYTRAVELVSDPESPGFYSRLFLVAIRGGGLCPVIDMSRLNVRQCRSWL